MKRPNVLLITADHMRYDCMGCVNPAAITPSLDRLAGGGVLFERLYVQNPLCMPSRASIFTGRYPSNHGVRTNGIPLPEREVTLAHVFAQEGYRTIQVGKLHFTPHKDRDHAAAHPRYGFHEMVLSDEPGCYPDEYVRWVRARDRGMVEKVRMPVPHYERRDSFDHRALDFDESWTHAGFVATETIRALKENGSKSLFLHAGFYNPHPPLYVVRKYVEMYEGRELPDRVARSGEMEDKPEYFREAHRKFAQVDEETWRRHRMFFYAYVTAMDAQIGRILDALDELDLAENTAVVFVSDHGDFLGDHGLTGKWFQNYDSVIRVPLLMRLPGKLEGGARVRGMAESVDILPTLCELCGLEIPEGVKGRSVLGALEAPEFRDSVFVDFRTPGGPGVKTVRTTKAKYHKTSEGDEVLFDLERDPDEYVNVARDPSERGLLEEMRERMLLRVLQAEDDLPARTNLY